MHVRQAVSTRGRARGDQRSCSRAIRAGVEAGFFDRPKSTRAVKGRLGEKGMVCSNGVLRAGLKKVVEEERLKAVGERRARVYSRAAESDVSLPPAESPEGETPASETASP